MGHRERKYEDEMTWKILFRFFWSGIWWNIAFYGIDGWKGVYKYLIFTAGARGKKVNFWYFRVTKSNDIDYCVAGSPFSVFNWIFRITSFTKFPRRSGMIFRDFRSRWWGGGLKFVSVELNLYSAGLFLRICGP